MAWEDRILKAINSIGDAPGYAIDEEATEKYRTTIRRYIFERSYALEYQIDDEHNVINILSFRHTSRLPGRS